MSDAAESTATFLGKTDILMFKPGEYQSYAFGGPMRALCVHFTAAEPIVAEFEVAFDGMLYKHPVMAIVEGALKHAIALIPCSCSPDVVTLRRKESDSTVPVFVLFVEGQDA